MPNLKESKHKRFKADMYVCKEGHIIFKKNNRPKKDGCYKEDYFNEKSKERYKREAKNSELKHRHGYDVASSSGLIGMEIQGAVTLFAVNLKRIINIMG